LLDRRTVTLAEADGEPAWQLRADEREVVVGTECEQESIGDLQQEPR